LSGGIHRKAIGRISGDTASQETGWQHGRQNDPHHVPVHSDRGWAEFASIATSPTGLPQCPQEGCPLDVARPVPRHDKQRRTTGLGSPTGQQANPPL
jgi:hypothetical protein